MSHYLKKGILAVLLLYVAYVLLAGVFSYLWPTPVKEKDRERFDAADLLGDGTEGVDRAALVENERDAFSRRVELIRSAKRELDVCCHCAKAGETVDCLFAELLKAADRGVKVRILMDGKVSGMTGSHRNLPLAMQAHENIEFRRYNPINLLEPWKWNVLMHDKFLIADDRLLMLGGRNMGDEYFDPPQYDGKVTHDRDVLVINTAAGTGQTADSVIHQAKAYMDRLWNEPDSKPVSLSKRNREAAWSEQQRLLAVAERWESAWPDYYLPKQDGTQISVPTSKITLLTGPVHTFKKEPVVAYQLFELLKTGDDVLIQTPYATANPQTLQALRGIAQHASSARMLTNSMASSPNYPAFSAYISNRARFVETGVQISEYQSTDSIHGKSFLMDGRIAAVGSLNLDDRSLYIDTETMLVIDSEPFYQQLRGEFDQLLAQSAPVGPDNRCQSQNRVEILPVPTSKKVIMGLVSIFSNLFRFLI